MCQFSGETDNSDFFGPNLPRNGFRVGNSETNVGIRISILEILCVSILSKN